uniref:Immunoglobulin C1-set domain-containing protein n=1 Tax=Chrysemys picta bellii TaxID=8478 RepID=A0A8C3HM85_CHRPI
MIVCLLHPTPGLQPACCFTLTLGSVLSCSVPHTATLPPESYYMQTLKTCELDNDTDAIRAVTRYLLNGEDVLWYQADQNRWFLVHPEALHVAELWNLSPARHVWLSNYSLRSKVTVRVRSPTMLSSRVTAFGPHPRDPGLAVLSHMPVTGFYPRDIEVTWERGGQVALGEQLTSGIRPNGDPIFQIQVSIELGQEGFGPTEHVMAPGSHWHWEWRCGHAPLFKA